MGGTEIEIHIQPGAVMDVGDLGAIRARGGELDESFASMMTLLAFGI